MSKEIFITSWADRQKLEDELLKFADKEINEFKGLRLMSWYSDQKQPFIDPDFIKSLSQEKKNQLQDLIESL